MQGAWSVRARGGSPRGRGSGVQGRRAGGLSHHQLVRCGDDAGRAVMTVDALDQHVQGDASQERLVRADRKSTRLNSSHVAISSAVFCLKKKKNLKKKINLLALMM